jgi:hypothetical protein
MDTPQTRWATVISVAISVSVMLAGVLYSYSHANPKIVQTSIRVVDSSTMQPVARAQVSLTTEEGSNIVGLTDENGLSLLAGVARPTPRSMARLAITADGYDTYTRMTRLGSTVDQISLRQNRTSVNSQIQVFTVTTDAVSGDGPSWGQLYELCSNPVPNGYRVVHAEFRLVGDRQCGVWAECREVEQNDSKVCWQFRLQGRGERLGGAGRAQSRGELTVTIGKLGQSDTQTQVAAQAVCHLYGQANQGSGAWNRDDVCTIPDINHLDHDYRQSDFRCCGGGATSPTTNAQIPPGLELRVTGGHYWSVANPRIEGDKFFLHTYCGPETFPGPGCNVDVEVIAHYRGAPDSK